MSTIAFKRHSRELPLSAQQPGLLTRIMIFIAASQQRRAKRELARYRHLLPHELQNRLDRTGGRGESSLPFLQ